MGGDYRGGRVEGYLAFSYCSARPPETCYRNADVGGGNTILTLPDELEGLLERIAPDYLGYDATYHSDECYTIIILTLDFKYTAWRAHLSLDGRWSLTPLDWAGTFKLVEMPEGEL